MNILVERNRTVTLFAKSAGPDDSALAFFNSPYKLSYVGGGSSLKIKIMVDIDKDRVHGAHIPLYV